MSEPVTKVGFIGLGRIGKPIAANLVSAGYDVVVHDLREEAVGDLERLGAKSAKSPRDIAERSELIELAVVNDRQVEEVLTGERGLFEGARSGTIVAIHSTIFPETIENLARIGNEKGVHVIDAPVSGGETGARDRRLCYMVGGDGAVLERCRAIFATSASHIFHMGPLGSGARAKMIAQLVVCVNMMAAHEADLLGERAGLDLAALREALHAGSAQSFVVDHWRERFKCPDEPIAIRRRRVEVFQQSLAPALEFARRMGLSLSGASLAERSLPQILGLEEE